MYEVYLTYFKQTGKYYSEGKYVSEKEEIFEIFQEVRELVETKKLPGLVDGAHGYYALVEVPDHPHSYPQLVIPDEYFPDELWLRRSIHVFAPEEGDLVVVRGMAFPSASVLDKLRQQMKEKGSSFTLLFLPIEGEVSIHRVRNNDLILVDIPLSENQKEELVKTYRERGMHITIESPRNS